MFRLPRPKNVLGETSLPSIRDHPTTTLSLSQVQTQANELVPIGPHGVLPRPTAADERAATKSTESALNAIILAKSTIKSTQSTQTSQYIHLQPSHNPTTGHVTSERVVRTVDRQIDPL